MILTENDLRQDIRYVPTINHSKIVRRSEEIKEPSTNEEKETLHKLLHKLVRTALREQGVGIAAPQIGVFKRLFLVQEIEGNGDKWKFKDRFRAMINPSYKPSSHETNLDVEGCLSVPEKTVPVNRYKNITAWWYEWDMKKNRFVINSKKMEGFEARIFAHEFDHLIAKCILDHQSKKKKGKK